MASDCSAPPGTTWEDSLTANTSTPSISVFFPAYNDAGTIPSMVMAVDMTLRRLCDDYEIIVVNDGSPDHVGEVLADLQPRYEHLRVVTHPRNRGYGGALRTGFAHARKDLIFYTDGDAQYDPRELTTLLARVADGVDVVNGYKLRRSDALHRKIVGRLYQWAVRLAFGLPIRDVDCDFRLFRRDVLDAIQLESDSGVITVEMVRKIHAAGFRFAEAPVHHYPRAAGRSQFFQLRRIAETLRDLVHLWWHLVWRQRMVAARRGHAP
ncbi:MAG: glycosyltransferase family 2 protein [Chloroflexi bacterium]|nr:glycosyltransferase family 2 protein [Chloroflexota bacterium]